MSRMRMMPENGTESRWLLMKSASSLPLELPHSIQYAPQRHRGAAERQIADVKVLNPRRSQRSNRAGADLLGRITGCEFTRKLRGYREEALQSLERTRICRTVEKNAEHTRQG